MSREQKKKKYVEYAKYVTQKFINPIPIVSETNSEEEEKKEKSHTTHADNSGCIDFIFTTNIKLSPNPWLSKKKPK